MADNLNGIPFSSAEEGIDFPRMAKELCYEQARALGVELEPSDVYIVWFNFTLGNFKAILSTPEPDGRMYEVTYSKEKSKAFVDTYLKTHNIEYDVQEPS